MKYKQAEYALDTANNQKPEKFSNQKFPANMQICI